MTTTCTFSALGERWTAWKIATGVNDDVRTRARLAPAAVGLYFRAADGEERFLAMSQADADGLGDLAKWPIQDLAAFAKRATVRPSADRG